MRKLATFAFSFSAAILAASIILPDNSAFGAACFFAALGGVFLLLRGNLRLRLCLIAFGSAAGMLFFFTAGELRYLPVKALDGTDGIFSAVVTDFPESTDYGARFDISLFSGGRKFNSRTYSFGSMPELTPGDVIEISGSIKRADELYGSESDAYISKGYFLFVYAEKIATSEDKGFVLRYAHKYASKEICEMISDIFSPGTRPFMLALLAGERGELYEDTEFSDALNVTGVRHIVVVSGMHLAYLTALVWALFGRRRHAALIAGPVILAFMAMTGFAPAVVRAGVMQLLMMAATFLEREDDAVTSLSAALMLLLAINPYSATDLGLQLTFAATLGMVLFTGRMYAALDGIFDKTDAYKVKPVKKLVKFIIANFSATLGASVLTLPIIAVRMGIVSLIAPLTNLFVTWAVALAFSAGLIAVILGFIWAPLGTVTAFCAGLPAKYIIWTIKELSAVRFAAVYTINTAIVYWVLYTAVVFLLFKLLRKERFSLIPALCLAALSLCTVLLLTDIKTERKGMMLTALDVGQGQCLILTSGSATAVIDCGSSSGEKAGILASQYIRSLGRDSIDVLILTHYHEDHANGASDILNILDVGVLIAPNTSITDSGSDVEVSELASQRGTEVIYVKDRVSVKLGKSVIDLYPPLGSEGENELGLTAVCTTGSFDVLVTGDMPSSMERKLVRTYKLPDTEVYIAGHHGSKYSTSDELLTAITPETVIVSVGYNTYGHPSEATLEKLEAVGAAVYRTDISGNIVISAGE